MVGRAHVLASAGHRVDQPAAGSQAALDDGHRGRQSVYRDVHQDRRAQHTVECAAMRHRSAWQHSVGHPAAQLRVHLLCQRDQLRGGIEPIDIPAELVELRRITA